MKVAFAVYGLLYVVVEVVGYQLERVSWPEITALDVATAVTNAFLTVAVLVAVLVAADVLGHRWRRHRRALAAERARLAAQAWTDPEPLTVQAWRPEPLALPAAPPPAPTGPARTAYAPNAYSRRAWPDQAAADASGRLL
ncbi:conserved protein of unknown function [Modestobacter italicus]|uniref:Uncharacterized protein n=1 Tax=Modestobacter italicus (strain DSM 44449 / CECT 9708 / BC 501) TaxID=2732864 RepID=I4F0Z0_MODI5|nr:hypothetical protein [Modestobacter marinus]CCH89303.1 conserved protein of unknown function [Modestobacter marinus]